MQQLFHITPFSSAILDTTWTGSPDMSSDSALLFSLQSFFKGIARSASTPFDPSDWICQYTKPTGEHLCLGVQEDAHEYLNGFLDRVETVLKHTDHATLIHDEFVSTVNVSVICPNCGIVLTRQEEYNCISVDVKGFSSLSDSLKAQCGSETIDDYFCEKCGTRGCVQKAQSFEATAPFLFFQLKRFEFDNFSFERHKINDFFTFPLELDLSLCFSDIRGKEPRYRLRGIITHSGSTEGGHYVSYVCGDGDEWWELNDSRVARVDGKDLLIRARGRGSVSVQWSLIINRMTARTSCCTRGTPSKPCPANPSPLRRRFPSCWGTPNSGTC